MNLVLTSFCFSTTNPRFFNEYFYRMPPISFRGSKGEFIPDWSAVLLADRFYADEKAAGRISEHPEFRQHALLLDALRECGRLEVTSFDTTVEPYAEIIKSTVAYDMRQMSAWLPAFEEAVRLWSDFASVAHARLVKQWRKGRRNEEPRRSHPHLWNLDIGMVSGLDYRLVENLRNWKKPLPKEYRTFTREIVSGYLEHATANLCLADVLQASICDWSDIIPLYRRKLSLGMRVLEERSGREMEQCQKLFELMFPDFQPKTIQHLVKALQDPRIEALRRLVSQAVDGTVAFDQEFANSTLKEVLKQELKSARAKKMVGWATKPLSFVPWIGDLSEVAIQQTADRFITARARRNHGWFFLISDITDHW